MEVGFLLAVAALLSCTVSFVHSASNKTNCDPGSNNVTCTQGACTPQPCSTICGATTPYDQCEQSCTGAVCDTLACTSSIVNCSQSCPGGRCKSLQCDSKRCEQECSGCNMTCSSNADECIQSCPGGLCKMTCASGVKECNQICSGGVCIFQCEADKCSQVCPGGGCTGINATKTSCDPGLSSNVKCYQGACAPLGFPQSCSTICGATTPYDQCEQSCTGAVCDTLACTSSIVNCSQSCPGGRCKSLQCDSKRCEQECSGCNMTCSSNADECIQSCPGGLCKMTCASGVKECNQICSGGGCIFQCEADKCSQACPGGGCTGINATKTSCDPGLSSNVKCYQGACSLQPCPTICGVTAPYDQCEQSCEGAVCDTLACTSSIVNCSQSCTGSRCKSLQCDSKRCEQECKGSMCNMTCSSSSDKCIQSCIGARCRMICAPGVKECQQICSGGECAFQCDADKCSLSCPGGFCSEIKATTSPTSTGADSNASVLPGLMLAIIAFVNNNQID